MRFFIQIGERLARVIYNPWQVLLLCLAIIFFHLVFRGSFLQLWRLNQDRTEIENRMKIISEYSKGLEMKIQRASDINYIEWEAMNRFDLVSEEDLVFVFSEGDIVKKE